MATSGRFDITAIFYRNIPLIVLLIFTWLKAAALFALPTEPDPGLFESFAYHIYHGKTLYADIWDHKPPLIFFLNFLFLYLFGISENAISFGSLVFCLIQTSVFYYIIESLFKNKFISFFSSLFFIFLFFSKPAFGTGNYTEQYAVLFTSSGLLAFINFLTSRKNQLLWLSGALFGISIWFKEPFLFSVIPYFLFLIYYSYKGKLPWISVLHFLFAFLIPALLTANLIVLTGGKEGYLEHLTHSKLYALASNTEPLSKKLLDNYMGFFGIFPYKIIVLMMYLICLGFMLISKNYRHIFVLIALQQFFDYLATGMSGNRFSHYYLQSLPLTILILTSALGKIGEINGFLREKKVSFLPLVIVVTVTAVVCTPWKSMAISPLKKFDDKVVKYLNENEYYKPRSVAMASKDIGYYLLRAQGISEVRYIVPYPYHWINIPGKEVHHQMKKDSALFMQWNPDYVIYSGTFTEMYVDCKLDSIILNNYYEVAVTELEPGGFARLLRRKKE